VREGLGWQVQDLRQAREQLRARGVRQVLQEKGAQDLHQVRLQLPWVQVVSQEWKGQVGQDWHQAQAQYSWVQGVSLE